MLLGLLGPQALEQLLWVQRADALAKGNGRGAAAAIRRIDAALAERERILREGECYSLAGLAVSGDDLLRAGLRSGPGVGRCLHRLLDQVIAGALPNQKEALMGYFCDQLLPQEGVEPYPPESPRRGL